MKMLILKNVTLALLLAVVSMPVTAQVYKTVDEDGNVVYTDQPPKDGSGPIDLPPISVIETPVYQKAVPAGADDAEGETSKKSLKFMQKHYEGFAIVSPQQEATIRYTEEAISVIWSTPNPLETGMQVTVSVNGRAQPPTRRPVVALTRLERGEYIVTAELRDVRNRLIVTAKPVTFFIRQPSVIMNSARPSASGDN